MTSPITSGAYALQRLQQLSHRLHHLQAEVLADRDPEPLHQYRVSLRRLRSVLVQFAPALVLPERVTCRRVALLARATGQARDADVLRQRLERDLLPALSAEQLQRCGHPLMERLARRRRKAFALLQAELLAPRTQRLLSRLHDWQQQPRFTPLGELPLRPWIREWLLALTGTCFLHAGWFAEQPEAAGLHDLRKRLKAVRYGLELLQDPLGAAGAVWLPAASRPGMPRGSL
jgi:CHAD domain-containing protein